MAPPPSSAESGGRPRSSRGPWLVPTARAVAWRPLAVVVPTLAVALALAHSAGAASVPPMLLGVALALLVAAALLGLDDPARDLLAAVPTNLARRRAQRLALLGPAAVGATVGLLVAGRQLDLAADPVGSGVASAAALSAVGLLAGRIAERWRMELLAPVGAAAPIAWVLVAAALPVEGVLGEVANGWAERPWPWALAATTAWLLASRQDPC